MGGVFDEPINPAPDITAPSTESLTRIKIDDETMAVVGSANWYAITYGNGKYVAISSDGYATTSTDGSTWTTPKQITSNSLYDILFADGKFVAVGTKTLVYSTDGNTWTTVKSTIFSSAYLSKIAYGNGIFVVCDSFRSYTSTDLATWNTGTTIGTTSVNTLTYGNGRFIATGNTGFCASSEDGRTWTKLNANLGSVSADRCVYGNGKFVISASGRIYTSADGANWTEIVMTYPAIGYLYVNDLVYSKSRFVWIGYRLSNGMKTYLVTTSSDGEIWADFAPLKDENGKDLTADPTAMIVMP